MLSFENKPRGQGFFLLFYKFWNLPSSSFSFKISLFFFIFFSSFSSSFFFALENSNAADAAFVHPFYSPPFLLLLLSLFLFSSFIVYLFFYNGNFLKIMIILEVAFMSVTLLFLAFSLLNDSLIGFIFIFFILGVLAAESALGLTIFLRSLSLR